MAMVLRAYEEVNVMGQPPNQSHGSSGAMGFIPRLWFLPLIFTPQTV